MKDVKVLIIRIFISISLIAGLYMCLIVYPVQFIIPLSFESMGKDLEFANYFYSIFQLCSSYYVSILTLVFLCLLWKITKYIEQDKLYTKEGLKLTFISTILILLITIIYTLLSIFFDQNMYVIILWQYQGKFIIAGFIISILLFFSTVCIKFKIKKCEN